MLLYFHRHFLEIPAWSCLEYFNNFSACIQHFPEAGLLNTWDSHNFCTRYGGVSIQMFESPNPNYDYKFGYKRFI